MKILILLFSVLVLSSCGKNNSDNGNGKEGEPQVTCGGMTKSSRSGSLCLPAFDTILYSSTLPKKIRLSIRLQDGSLSDLLDECRFSDGEVDRSSEIDVIHLKFHGVGLLKETHWVITDRGDNCDNDAIFFDSSVMPVVSGRKISFTLNN